jgi:hypothetical protein
LAEAASKAPEERTVPREDLQMIHKPRRGVLFNKKQFAPTELMREGSRMLGTGRPSGTSPDSKLNRQLLGSSTRLVPEQSNNRRYWLILTEYITTAKNAMEAPESLVN